MKRQLFVCGITALTLICGSQAVLAGGKVKDKVYDPNKAGGLKIEGKVADNDPNHKFEISKGNETERPGKLYLVKLAAGKKYRVTMDSDQIDSVLVIKDGADKQLAWDDDGGGDLNSLIVFEPTKSGIYKICTLSLGSNPGNYVFQIKVEGVKAEPLAALEVGKDGLKFEATILENDPRISFVPAPFKDSEVLLPGKGYEVKLAGGKKYKVTMTSTEIPSVLVVKDPAGKQLAWDDKSGVQMTSTLTFETGKDGTYKIYALSVNGKSGDFTLQIQMDAAAAKKKRVPPPAPGGVSGEVRIFRSTKTVNAADSMAIVSARQ